MSIDSGLLELLACPACKGKLLHRASPESLDCAACKLSYPVDDGIPMLIADAAKPLA